jgi:VanZ family protein
LHKPKSARHWTYYWIPALIWLALVALFSSGSFGAQNTGGVLAWVMRTFHIVLTAKQFAFLHGLIRKSAHFCAYGLLSALFFRAWRGASAGWRWTWAVLALLVALATSSSDELHQHFTPGRTGAISDVELDMTGATFAQLMIVAFTARRRK